MIEFIDVSKTFPEGNHAVENINLTILDGEFVFIVGPSGAGKSTMLKLIMREELPSSGTVTVNGRDITKMKRKQVPYLRRTMGIVFQDFRLIDKMTVFENVAFAMRVTGAKQSEIKKRVKYVLELVGLEGMDTRHPSELSGGEQQRVSLARALVNKPSLIIADEPTGNVDPKRSFEIMKLLKEINKMGTTVLVVTHEHSIVNQIDGRLIVLNEGKIVRDTVDDYYSNKSREDKNSPDRFKAFEDNGEYRRKNRFKNDEDTKKLKSLKNEASDSGMKDEYLEDDDLEDEDAEEEYFIEEDKYLSRRNFEKDSDNVYGEGIEPLEAKENENEEYEKINKRVDSLLKDLSGEI